MVKKARIIVSVLVIVIIGFLVIPVESDDSESITTIYESDFVKSDDINMDQVIIDQAIQEYSIIETNRVFTESDQSLVEQFLDESGLPSSSEKFGIEVQTVLFDSDQVQYPESSILGIPQDPLSVVDEQGRVLDLGTIQTSFLGITTDSQRGSEQQFNLDGTVKFYLDDDLVATKKLYSSESGDSNTHNISLLDSIPPKSFDRPTTFTFTLSDEGRDWKDKSNHVYRVVITEINAELKSDNDIKTYTWNGEEIVYELKVTVDGSKRVILNESGKAISVFKNDSTIQICGTSTAQEIPYKGWERKFSDNPNVKVFVRDEFNRDGQYFPIGATPVIDFDFSSDNPKIPKYKKHWFGKLAVENSCSDKISGIPRNADIVIQLDYDDNSRDSQYDVKTPKTQKNYYVNELLVEKSRYPVYPDSGSGGNDYISLQYNVGYGGTQSNFIE